MPTRKLQYRAGAGSSVGKFDYFLFKLDKTVGLTERWPCAPGTPSLQVIESDWHRGSSLHGAAVLCPRGGRIVTCFTVLCCWPKAVSRREISRGAVHSLFTSCGASPLTGGNKARRPRSIHREPRPMSRFSIYRRYLPEEGQFQVFTGIKKKGSVHGVYECHKRAGRKLIDLRPRPPHYCKEVLT